MFELYLSRFVDMYFICRVRMTNVISLDFLMLFLFLLFVSFYYLHETRSICIIKCVFDGRRNAKPRNTKLHNINYLRHLDHCSLLTLMQLQCNIYIQTRHHRIVNHCAANLFIYNNSPVFKNKNVQHNRWKYPQWLSLSDSNRQPRKEERKK